jgi:hypothetical protein
MLNSYHLVGSFFMRIKLSRRLISSFDSTEQRIRSTLAHITNKIWIKDIVVDPVHSSRLGQKVDDVTIICEPQADTIEDEKLVAKVREAISLDGELTLHEIIIQRTRQDEAITKINNSNSYDVDLYFASLVASDAEYRNTLLSKKIIKVTIEYRETAPGSYTSTGKRCTVAPSGEEKTSFDPANPYHVFAATVNTNNNLRAGLLRDNIEAVRFRISSHQQAQFKIITSDTYTVALPAPVAQPNAGPIVNQLTNLFGRTDLNAPRTEQREEENGGSLKPTHNRSNSQ